MDRGGQGSASEDRLVCRRAGLGGGKWTRKEEEPKYAPDRSCDVEHLKLEVTVDLSGHAVDAVCYQRIRAAYGPIEAVTLNAVGLQVHSVRDAWGRDLPHTNLNHKLTVRFPDPIVETEELVIRYRVEDPVEGLFFFGPNDDEPNATPQMWSQGEDEGARHWIPCHDAPNERMTTELVVTAPEIYTVISNGSLENVHHHGGMKTWRFFEKVPHPTYLISLVVGVFSRIEDRWNDIPVEYFVEPGKEEQGRRSFGRTPEMIEFFSRQLDRPYPYEKYAQVAVRHFHFGGMENTSATTQTDGTLHDERAALDFSSDELVAHELAHQWFGDLITCKSWTHAWLNEGFATYFEALWKEWDQGCEEFDYEMILNAGLYLAEEYRRPIVTSKYEHPFEMFDMHLYPKAAWVLHMLRRQLGDDLFWKALRLYLQRHAVGVVETIDLIRAFEDATGKNLSGFFDQWIQSPGHVELEGEISWEQEHSRVKLSLKQVQKREDGTPIFHIPIRLDAHVDGGAVRTASFRMDEAEQTFFWALPGKPAWVLFDPDGAVLRETKIKQPLEWMEAALRGDRREPRVFPRVDLVRQLAEDAGPKATRLLGQVLLQDPFWGVQAEAAKILGKLRTPAALEQLLSAVEVPHPKARRAVVTALGNWQDPRAVEALHRTVQEGDAAYHVQMAANTALGHSGGLAVAEELKAQLHQALARHDWHDVIALGAAEGLVAARDETAVDDLLMLARDRSRHWRARLSAMKGLGELGAARPRLAPRIAEELQPFLEDPEFLVASRMPGALVTLGDQSSVAALRRKGQTSPRAEMRKTCLMSAEELAGSVARGEEVDRLRTEQDKLRDEIKLLKETVASISNKVMPEKDGSAAASKDAHPKKRTPNRTAAAGSGGATARARRPKGREGDSRKAGGAAVKKDSGTRALAGKSPAKMASTPKKPGAPKPRTTKPGTKKP